MSKILLLMLILGFAGFTALVATTEVMFSFMEIIDTLLGRLILADLVAALCLFGAWAIIRDGWIKGIAWTVSFLILGSPGVAIYLLWNLRGVTEREDLPRFLLGRQLPGKAARSKEEKERPSGAYARPATA